MKNEGSELGKREIEHSWMVFTVSSPDGKVFTVSSPDLPSPSEI